MLFSCLLLCLDLICVFVVFLLSGWLLNYFLCSGQLLALFLASSCWFSPCCVPPLSPASLLPTLTRSPQDYPCSPIPANVYVLQKDVCPWLCAWARSTSSPCEDLPSCFLHLHRFCAACLGCLRTSFLVFSVYLDIGSSRTQFPIFRVPLLSACNLAHSCRSCVGSFRSTKRWIMRLLCCCQVWPRTAVFNLD